MKIVQLNSVYGYASTGKIVASIHENLLKQGHDSHVIYSRKEPKNATSHNVTRIYSGVGVATHAALGLLFDRHGLYSRTSTKKIIAKIEEIDPDVIHLHVIHGFYCHYPMLFDYLKKSKKRVIWTLHDCWEYTGFCAYYDYNNCSEWKNKCQNCNYRNTYPYRLLSNSRQNFKLKENAYKDVNLHLISPSKWLDGEVSKSMLSHVAHSVINNDVNLKDFYYEENNVKEIYGIQDKKVILAVANIWTKQKGFDEIIKLQAKLSQDDKIVMIGLSKAQIKKCPPEILGFERMQLADLRKWYSAATVFVNCTLQENYPTVHLEANACGLPILTYNTGGSKETISELDEVVDKYDLDGLVAKLKVMNLERRTPKVAPTQMFDEYLKLYMAEKHD